MIAFTITNKSRPKATVIMIVSYAGRQYRVSCGVGLPPKMWSDKKHRAKVTADFDGSGINDTLDRYESAAKSYLKKCSEMNTVPTQDEFRKFVSDVVRAGTERKKGGNGQSLTSYIKEVYLPRYERVRARNTVKGYITAYNQLCEYEMSRGPVPIGSVGISFYNDFKEWFFSPRGGDGRIFTINYFGSIIKFVKQVVREARIVDRLHTSDGIEHRDFVKTQESAGAVYLTLDELRAVECLDISAISVLPRVREAMERARAFFLIGCYTGLRVSDFARLTKDNFDGDFIRVRTQKTKDDLVIPIHPVVRRILDSGFDISQRVSDQKLNEHIKEVCRLAGILQEVTVYRTQGSETVPITRQKWELVTNHTARRSFATNAYKMGVPTIAIMKITGHRRSETFMKYIKITEQENAEIVAKSAFFQTNGATDSTTNLVND